MPAFSINFKQRVVLVSPAFSSSQMRMIGTVAVAQEKRRLAAGVDLNDRPAKQLSPQYARRKKRLRGSAIRDLNLTGGTLAALAILNSSPVSVEIGFATPEAARKAALNDSIDEMVGLSARDEVVVDAKVRGIFAGNMRRANQGQR